MADNVKKYVEGIQNAAHDNYEILLPAGKALVSGLRGHGWTIERILAFLLVSAVDAHLEQPDVEDHTEQLADALEAFARSVQVGVDVIREIERGVSEPYYEAAEDDAA